MMQSSYHLGCPVWQADAWRGGFFPSRMQRAESLVHYGAVFNTVEGNSTFYAIPDLAVVRRWVDQTPAGFRFALKFPRAISHEQPLTADSDEWHRFRACLELLHEHGRLGPAFLQLPPAFDGASFARLDAFLRRLPREMPFAVEVRHRDFFAGPLADRLDERLREEAVDRVQFDSRPLYSEPPSDESERESQRRKPRSPIRKVVTGRHPLLRLVGRNDIQVAEPWLEEWATEVAEWVGQGLLPFIFMHTPDDAHAPAMARRFHEVLRSKIPHLAPLPDWPGESERKQQRLF